MVFKKSIFKLFLLSKDALECLIYFPFFFNSLTLSDGRQNVNHIIFIPLLLSLSVERPENVYDNFFFSLSAGRPEPETEQRSGGHADQVQCYLPYFITVIP